MPGLADAIVTQLWLAAGGSQAAAPVALAVGKAESGLDPNSENRNANGTIDRGLFQINSSHGAASSFDPATNARAAVSLSGAGKDWKQWCTAWSDGACGTKGGSPPPAGGVAAGSPAAKYLTGGGGIPLGTGGAGVQTVGDKGSFNPLSPGDWQAMILAAGMTVAGALVLAGALYLLGKVAMAQAPAGLGTLAAAGRRVTPAGRATRAAARVRRDAPVNRERRAAETHAARLEAARRRAPAGRSRPKTVYVTEADPAARRAAARARLASSRRLPPGSPPPF